jgi:hypothetical protein
MAGPIKDTKEAMQRYVSATFVIDIVKKLAYFVLMKQTW